MLRRVILFVVAIAALAVVAGPVAAKGGGSGGNSLNAKSCQKDGWKALARSTSPTVAFTSEEECTSYAAKKGNTIIALETSSGDPVAALCTGMGGTLTYDNTSYDGGQSFRYFTCAKSGMTNAEYQSFYETIAVREACYSSSAPDYGGGGFAPIYAPGTWDIVAATCKGYSLYDW